MNNLTVNLARKAEIQRQLRLMIHASGTFNSQEAARVAELATVDQAIEKAGKQ
jgi:hypothetical protein